MTWDPSSGGFRPGVPGLASLPGQSGGGTSAAVTVQDLINLGLIDPGAGRTGGSLPNPDVSPFTASVVRALSASAASIELNSATLFKKMNGSAGVVIGSAGIAGYNSAGTATFTIDPATGDVTLSGTITAVAGTIGGWTIGATSLSAVSGGNTTTLSSGATAFSAGPTATPTVTITQAGVLTATGGTFSGTLNISSALNVSNGATPKGTISAGTNFFVIAGTGTVAGGNAECVVIKTGDTAAGSFASGTGHLVFLPEGPCTIYGSNGASRISMGTTVDIGLGNFTVATDKFSVDRSNGNVLVAGTLGVTGAITGNLTGNASGSSGSCTGNAATATNSTQWSAVTLQGIVSDGTSTATPVLTTLPHSSGLTGKWVQATDTVTGKKFWWQGYLEP